MSERSNYYLWFYKLAIKTLKCLTRNFVCSERLSLLLSSGETFSENFSHTETCKPCTACSELSRMLTPCTDANDAVCVCDYGSFFSTVTGRCEACTVCPLGYGVLIRCNYDHDTECEECLDETFSDQETSFDPCLPCTQCEQLEMEVKNCTSVSDTICQGKRIKNQNQIKTVSRWVTMTQCAKWFSVTHPIACF